MTFTTASPVANLQNLQASVLGVKSQAQNAIAQLQAGLVSTQFIFAILDQLNATISFLNNVAGIVNVNTLATQQGYPGTLTTDITGVVSAAQAVINWVVANFPAASGWLQAFKLNADGTRTAATFTTVQTAGLVTVLQGFVATIV